MDATKRDLIEHIYSLANTKPTVMLIVAKYSAKYNKPRKEVIQSHINDITMDIVDYQIKLREETEGMMRDMLSKDKWILNVY